MNQGNVNLGNPNMNLPVSSANHNINFSAQPPSIQPNNLLNTSNQNDPASDFSNNNNNTSITSNNFSNSSVQQRVNSLSLSQSLTQMNVQQTNPLLSNTSNIMNPVQKVAMQQALLEAQRQRKVHSIILFDLYCSV